MEGSATVQHVTKKSSDQLLRKFAEAEDEHNDKKEIIRLPKRRRKTIAKTRAPDTSSCLVEKRSLLPPVTGKSRIMRHLVIGKSRLKARDINKISILVAIEKSWRKTLEGATRVLLDNHYNRHKRLISDY